MANLERKYIITMRKDMKKVPYYLRARKAVKVVRKFLQKHMKCEDVRLEKHLNLLLWSRGNRNPPHRVEVIATKFEEKDRTFVRAEIVGAPKEEVKAEPKKKGLVSKLKSGISVKEEQKQDEKKEEQKEELKELKKEEKEVMEHAEAPHSKAESKVKKKEQTGFEKERAAIVKGKKDTQHKKPKGE